MQAEQVHDALAQWFAPCGLVPMWPWAITDQLQATGRQTLATSGLPVADRELYLFRRSTARSLLAAGAPAFAASFWGHGLNSYAWTLYDRRPGLRFYAQAHHGVAYGSPEDNAVAQHHLVRLHDLAVLAAPYCTDVELVVASSPMRGHLILHTARPSEDLTVTPEMDAVPPAEAEELLVQLAAKAGAPRALLSGRWADTRRKWRPRISKAIETLGVASWTMDEHVYVQCAAWPEGLQVEVAAGAGPGQPVSLGVRRQLQQQGWQAPRPPELPNLWQRLETPVDLDQAVDLLVGGAAAVVGRASEAGMDMPADRPARVVDAEMDASPKQSPKPGTARSARSVLLVPFFKTGGDTVELAVAAWLRSTAGRSTAALDLFGAKRDGDGRSFQLPDQLADAIGAQDQRLNLTVDQRRLTGTGKPAELLRLLADVSEGTNMLQQRGRDVLVLAPWALPDAWWLFAAAVHAVADASVVVAHLHPDDISAWEGLAGVLGMRELHSWRSVDRRVVALTDDEERLLRLAEATGVTEVEAVPSSAEPYELEYALRAAIEGVLSNPD